MPGSSFGQQLKITTWGESHGGSLGVVIDGLPPGIALDLPAVQRQLDRRRPGQSHLTTQRKETDILHVQSGLLDGRTLGTPLAVRFENKDARSRDYAPHHDRYRPGHADFTWDAKMGLRAWAGGGRASARETVARVAAGAIAEQVLQHLTDNTTSIVAWVDQVGEICSQLDPGQPTLGGQPLTREMVDAHLVRCPTPEKAAQMTTLIESVRKDGDTIGGCIRCVAQGFGPGLGEPVFDKLHADLAKGMMSLPAARGFEVGQGFASITMRGSEHNDPFVPGERQPITTSSNHAGGVLGGISTGLPICFRVAFKPVSTIFKPQQTVTRAGEAATLQNRGRHDPCVLPRAVAMVESMTALVLLDHWLRLRAQVGQLPKLPLG